MRSVNNEAQAQTAQETEQRPNARKDLSRRDARSLVFHLLYAAESFDYQETLAALVDNFNRGFDLSIDPEGELVVTARAIIEKRDELDEAYKKLLTNWRFERIGVCTKLILRYAVWEFYYTQIDQRIIINEAVELAKCYAEKDAYRFINGILDKVAKEREMLSSS